MAGRFSTAAATTEPDRSAYKNILAGGPNVGKTYFASTIDNVFILPIEEGLKGASPNHTPGRFRIVPENLADLYDAMNTFEYELNVPATKGDRSTIPYRHLVLDSLSGLEKLVHAAACETEGVKHMEGADYKKVWSAAITYWRGVQAALDRIRRGGVHVWVIAHTIEDYASDPIKGDLFKCWDLMMSGTNKTLAEARHLWRSWADNIFYIVKTHQVKKGNKERRATSEFKGRIMITQEMAGFAAKSRGSLPPSIPATWPDLKRAWMANAPAKPDKMLAQIDALLATLSDEDREEIRKDLQIAKSPTQLATVLSRAQGMAELAAQERGDQPDGKDDKADGAPSEMTDEQQAAAIDAGLA